MLELNSLVVAHGSFRLNRVNLVVPSGECHAVLGPSGSGKSTLLQAILGVLKIQSGHLRLDGRDISSLPIEQRGMGYVSQQLGLFPHLNVRDNITYSLRARKIPSVASSLDSLVAATNLGPLLDRMPHTLSGGERQRVGLVRALASQPKLVLLDEPFAALNESLKRDLWWMMRDLQRECGLTILLVTHDLQEAYFLARQISVLLDGQIIQQGDKEEIYAHPTHPDVAHFLGVETLQPGKIVDVREGLATVEVGRVRLTALAPQDAGREVLISIRGEDVTLQLEASRHSSARNQLEARVVAIHPGRPLRQVELDAGFPLRACITQSACEQMALQPGMLLTACVKTPSVHLIPRMARASQPQGI